MSSEILRRVLVWLLLLPVPAYPAAGADTIAAPLPSVRQTPLSSTGTSVADCSASQSGFDAEAAALAAGRTFTYNGEDEDPRSQLLYLRTRDYDPHTMRFITRDTWLVWNRYNFTNGNPIEHIDPEGSHSRQLLTNILSLVSIGSTLGSLLFSTTTTLNLITGTLSILSNTALISHQAVKANGHYPRETILLRSGSQYLAVISSILAFSTSSPGFFNRLSASSVLASSSLDLGHNLMQNIYRNNPQTRQLLDHLGDSLGIINDLNAIVQTGRLFVTGFRGSQKTEMSPNQPFSTPDSSARGQLSPPETPSP